MGFTDFLSSFGLSKINAKFIIEIFSQQIIKHSGHEVNRYIMTLNKATGFVEFLVFWPDNLKDCPDTYRNPKNYNFKGQIRGTPDFARYYDMEVKKQISVIEGFISSMVPEFDGELDFVKMDIDRNAKEVPCELYYTKDGEKVKIKHILK